MNGFLVCYQFGQDNGFSVILLLINRLRWSCDETRYTTITLNIANNEQEIL